MSETVTLWRPTGKTEIDLVAQSGWKKWPPRLPEQPIFYPVLNRAYATRIAREWNVPEKGVGYVTCFEVRKSFLGRYQVQKVGGKDILEYWIPAADLEEMNANIVGGIREIAEYRGSVPEDDLKAAESALKYSLPDSWKRYLRQASWFSRGFPSEECFLQLYTPAQSVDISGSWRSSTGSKEMVFILGSDGGGEYIALDLASPSPKVMLIATVTSGWSEAIEQSATVEEFVLRLEDGSFTFTF
jgi:hypothetical protein